MLLFEQEKKYIQFSYCFFIVSASTTRWWIRTTMTCISTVAVETSAVNWQNMPIQSRRIHFLFPKIVGHLYFIFYIFLYYILYFTSLPYNKVTPIPLHTYLPQHMYICILFVLLCYCRYCCFCLLFQLYLTSVRPSGRKDANKLID